MFDLMQYALIFYDFQLILAQMGGTPVRGVADAKTPGTYRGGSATGRHGVTRAAVARKQEQGSRPQGDQGLNTLDFRLGIRSHVRDRDG